MTLSLPVFDLFLVAPIALGCFLLGALVGYASRRA